MNCHKSNFISQFGIDLRISKFMNFSGMFKNCWKLEPKIHVNSINLSLKNTNTLFICILVHRIIVKYSRSRDWNRFLRSWQLKQQTWRTAVGWACSDHVPCCVRDYLRNWAAYEWSRLAEECVRAGSQFMCRYLHRRRQRVTLMVTQPTRCSEVAKLVQLGRTYLVPLSIAFYISMRFEAKNIRFSDCQQNSSHPQTWASELCELFWCGFEDYVSM